MNQKNVFTVLAILGIGFSLFSYFMGAQIGKNSFPELSELGMFAVGINQELVAMVNLIVVLAMFASRDNPKVLWAFTLGFFLLGLNTLKHMVIDGVNVPIMGVVIQWGITLVIGYLWLQHRKKGSEVAVA
jgi:threonine/homoserine efflux transporter RhtA